MRIPTYWNRGAFVLYPAGSERSSTITPDVLEIQHTITFYPHLRSPRARPDPLDIYA